MSNEKKNYGIGRFTSIWWNEGRDGRAGFYTIQIRRVYKDSSGTDVEQKISLFADDVIRLAAELERAKLVLLQPREIVRQTVEPDVPSATDDIPF